jgi:hypothetical protein
MMKDHPPAIHRKTVVTHMVIGLLITMVGLGLVFSIGYMPYGLIVTAIGLAWLVYAWYRRSREFGT